MPSVHAKTKRRRAQVDPVRHYAEEVLAGGIIAGPYVRLACQRHLEDLQDGRKRGLRYDNDLAQVAFEFWKTLSLPEGDPFDLLPWQQFNVGSILAWLGPDGYRRFRVAYIEAGKGQGKALAVDTPIPTPGGWKTMGELSPGDRVFDETGNICNVTAVSEVMHDRRCYRMQFSDGCEIIADRNHLWVTTAMRNQGKFGPKSLLASRKGKPHVRATWEIRNTLRVAESSSIHPQAKWNHRVDVAGPLVLNDCDLPIHPYVLGFWLGDGDSDCARVTIGDADAGELVQCLRDSGCHVGDPHGKQGSNACRYRIGGREKGTSNVTLNEKLRTMGLLRNKHIPAVYLRASIAQRTELLRGLMDTDGYVSQSGNLCEFTTVRPVLRDGIIELLTTLGYKPMGSTGRATINGKDCGEKYRVTFTATRENLPFRLTRKNNRIRPAHGTRPLSKGRMIVGCDQVDSVPVKCIAVDSPSRLYLAGKGMIPTHNSPLMGGLALYGSNVDEEPLPEIYVCATKREQAKICWNDAVNICKNSEIFEGRYQAFSNSLYFPETGAVIKPMSADKKQSGFRPHFGLVDEVHEHPTDVIISMLRAGFKRRRQPLLVEITNTPQSEKSVCGSHRDYSVKVLKKVYQNDQWFAYVCSLDQGDDWKDESVWEKANPSLGTVVNVKYLRERVQEASGIKDQEDEVKRLNFCIMSSSSKRSIDLAQWDRNNPTVHVTLEEQAMRYRQWAESLRGRECFGGLDVGKVSDLTAYVLFFPPDGDLRPAWLSWYWCPEEDIVARSRAGVPYDVWARMGFLKTTEGNTTDFDFVEKDILALHQIYQISRSAFDRTFAGEIVQHLINEGCDMLDFGQGFVSLSTPTEYLLRYIKAGELEHGSHPVTRWCAENLVCQKDPAGNLKPDKARSPEKIDGISAGVNAIGAWLDKRPRQSSGSGGFEVW